jgi:hypothetical protein
VPGWANSDRRETLPPDWESRVRPVILERDQRRCQWRTRRGICGRYATDVDHIGDRDDHRPENLQALCTPHHRHKSSGEGGRARWAKAKSRRTREPRPHPGTIEPERADVTQREAPGGNPSPR